MEKPRPLAIGIAVIFLCLIVAGLAARFWATHKAIQSTGPTHLAVGNGAIILFAASDLYHLDLSGKLLEVIPITRLGLHEDPIDLGLLQDGSLLIAGQRPATVVQCTIASWDCQALPIPGLSVIQRQFKLLPDLQKEGFLVSDARGDMLWRLGSSGGQQPMNLIGAGVLAGPNDLRFDQKGNLWIADTDNRRIVELKPAAEGQFEVVGEHPARNDYTSGNRHFPMMVAPAPEGKIWVTQADEIGRPGADVLVYDPLAGARARIALPRGAYATDIALLDEAILITDMDRFAVYRVDRSSRQWEAFGDEQFQQLLARLKSERKRFQAISTAALIVIVLAALAMIPALLLSTPRERRWTALPGAIDVDSAADKTPPVKGIYWLKRDPRLDRRLKWLEYSTYFIFIMLLGGSVVHVAWFAARAGSVAQETAVYGAPQLVLLLAANGLLLVFLMIVVRNTVRAMKQQLGTDGRNILVRFADGRELLKNPAELSYTARAVFFRGHVIPISGTRQQAIYQPGEVDTWLAPLLKQSGKLTEFQAIKRQLGNQAGILLLAVVLLVAISVILFLAEVGLP